MSYSEATKREFARWYVRTETQRVQRWGMNAPRSRKAYARAHEMSARTLIRWEEDADEQGTLMHRLVREAQAELDAGLADLHHEDDAPPLPASLGGSQLEREFEEVRTALFEKAASGDTTAVKVWLSEFGATLVEAERQALESDLASLSDIELVASAQELSRTLESMLAGTWA